MYDDWNKSEKHILGVVGLSFRQTPYSQTETERNVTVVSLLYCDYILSFQTQISHSKKAVLSSFKHEFFPVYSLLNQKSGL